MVVLEASSPTTSWPYMTHAPSPQQPGPESASAWRADLSAPQRILTLLSPPYPFNLQTHMGRAPDSTVSCRMDH